MKASPTTDSVRLVYKNATLILKGLAKASESVVKVTAFQVGLTMTINNSELNISRRKEFTRNIGAQRHTG